MKTFVILTCRADGAAEAVLRAEAFPWLRGTPVFLINELCMRCAVQTSR